MKSPVQTPSDQQSPAEPVLPREDRAMEPLIRYGGLVVAIVAAAVSAAFELMLTTMRLGDLVHVWSGQTIGSGGGPLIGISIVLALAGNVAIGWFAYSTTGRRWAVAPPWGIWTVIVFYAATARTAEGDFLVAGNDYIAVTMILLGSVAFAVYTYRLILRRGRL